MVANGGTLQKPKRAIPCFDLKEEDMKSGIYQIKNKLNGHKYIGQSNNIQRRWTEHRSPARKKSIVLDRAIEKHGIGSFLFETLEFCPTEFLNEREVFYIELLQPEYNMNKGGAGNVGHKQRERAKRILAEKAKKQWERKTDAEKRMVLEKNLIGPKKGHTVSLETRAKISQKLKGGKTSDLQKTRSREVNQVLLVGNCRGNKPVAQIDVSTGVIIQEYESVKAATMAVGLSHAGISQVLSGKQKTAGGYFWAPVSKGRSVETIPQGSRAEDELPLQAQGGHDVVHDIVHTMAMVKPWVSDRGMIQLAIRSGQYRYINAGPIFEGQTVKTDFLTGASTIEGEPSSASAIGYFAHLELLNGFSKTVFWTVQQMEAHAKKFSKSFALPSSPWKSNFDGMATKTMLRSLLSKYGILSVEMVHALAADRDETEHEERIHVEIMENANMGDVVDIPPPINGGPAPVPVPVPEPAHTPQEEGDPGF